MEERTRKITCGTHTIRRALDEAGVTHASTACVRSENERDVKVVTAREKQDRDKIPKWRAGRQSIKERRRTTEEGSVG